MAAMGGPWFRATASVLLGGGLTAGAAVLGSVAWVRAAARGRLFADRDLAAVPAAPVALVLGAQVYPDGTPSPFLAARLDLAKRLYDLGRIRVLLVSGDATAPEGDEPAAMRRYLVARGVPADRVVVDPAGFDTYDSCVRALQVYGVQELVVVTQAYHLPRAVGTARHLGLDAHGVGDDTVRHRWSWWRGTVRDQVACVKTVLDVVTRRIPVLDGPDDAVRRALAA